MLAQWLVLPFFLSILQGARSAALKTVTIGVTILLTGSLTGIISLIAGYTGALLISFRKVEKRPSWGGLLLGLICITVFSYLAISNRGDDIHPLAAIVDRITNIMNNGVEVSGRGYIYSFVSNVPVPEFGYGLGNAQILLSRFVESGLIVSYLSVYLNFLYSFGIVGLFILLAFFLFPIIFFLHKTKSQLQRQSKEIFFLLSAYIAWLIMFAVLSEEFTLMFAVSYALLVFSIQQNFGNKENREDRGLAIK